MKVGIFLLILIPYSLLGQLGQSFLKCRDTAVTFLNRGEYQKASLQLDRLFQMYESGCPVPSCYYLGFIADLNTGDTTKAIEYFDKYARSEWIALEKLYAKPYHSSLSSWPDWHTLIHGIEEKQKKYNALRMQLEEIDRRDQCLRKLWGCAEETFAEDSLSMRSYRSLLRQQDSLNLYAVCSLIDQYGWVGRNKVGEKANSTLWQVIQHADYETQKRYFPYLKKSVQLGETLPRKLAYLEDSMLMYRGEPQKYGSQFLGLPDRNVLYPVENIQQIDEFRKSVGMGPISDYLKEWDIEMYNEEERSQLIDLVVGTIR